MKLSALILAKNEETLIGDCLKQLSFVDEIIVLDQDSSDQTEKIAKKYATKVLKTNKTNFDTNRNILKDEASGEWLLYVDCDERISNNLINEISTLITNSEFSAYYFPRKNYVLGKWLRHGGWWPDYVPKLFKKENLTKWQGVVHESPQVEGDFGYIKHPIEHYTASSISKMLSKTIRWAKIEADLRYKANQPPVTALKVTKTVFLEFTNRYFIKVGILDGVVGLIESIFQALHQAAVLIYLWELQNDTLSKFNKIKNE